MRLAESPNHGIDDVCLLVNGQITPQFPRLRVDGVVEHAPIFPLVEMLDEALYVLNHARVIMLPPFNVETDGLGFLVKLIEDFPPKLRDGQGYIRQKQLRNLVDSDRYVL